MLDTGHFMNSNYELETPADALVYLHQMLDEHEALLPMIRGIHLNQSLSGHYMKDYRKHPLIPKQIRPSWPPRPSCIFFR